MARTEALERETPEEAFPSAWRRVNVGPGERALSVLAGAFLIGWSLKMRRFQAALVPLGAGLLARGVTGHSFLNDVLGRDTTFRPTSSSLAAVRNKRGIRIDRSIVVHRPPAEVYGFVRHLENLPRFIDHLESVIDVGDGRSHWIARGPAGLKLEWDAELLNVEENVRISWRALPNADFHHAGSIWFEAAPDDRTVVRLHLSYEPIGGRLGNAIARLMGASPGKSLQQDLMRLKDLLEKGEAEPGGRRRPEGVH